MYESPVRIWDDVSRFAENIVRARDEYIFSQIRTVVDVDRDELVKALEYDRDQYYKGYKDRDAEIVRCKDCERLSNVRVAPKGERICLRYCCGKKEDGFCDEGERREDDSNV